MKALRIHGYCKTSVDEIPAKEPQQGEALIRIHAVGICGSDVELYYNDNPHIKAGRTKLPLIPGHEWSGVIEKLGPDTDGFLVGDKVVGEVAVYCGRCDACRGGYYNLCDHLREVGIFQQDGAFAEYITLPVYLLHKFEELSFEQAALIEPMSVSLYAVQKAQVSPTDTVLVTGDGPIGLLAVQILKRVYGVKHVLLSGRRTARLAIGAALGADLTINAREQDVKAAILECTHGRLLDRVIESSGGSDVYQQLKDTVRQRGVIVAVGLFGSKQAPIDWDELVLKELMIIGANGSPSNWEETIDLAQSGKVQLQPLISHVLPLAEFDKAMDLIVGKKENACKIVIQV